MNASSTRITLVTAGNPGAVAIIQLIGPDAPTVLAQLTGLEAWPKNRLRLAKFGDIDEGLATLLRPDWAQVMPHGGPRVVRRMLDRLIELGCVYEAEPAARDVYPEAPSELEADMLATLARAASPAAIDLLIEQPRLWSAFFSRRAGPYRPGPILARSDTLDRLVNPPSVVVVVGRPNVGKSTLTNRMLGRAASIVSDLPGTTRDWVGGLTEIDGVALRWLDTPGMRHSDDPIEQRAIEMATQVIQAADVLIAMRDPTLDWPALDRAPQIRVLNKCDLQPPLTHNPDVIPISAATGEGIQQLQHAVLETLGLMPRSNSREPWAFSKRLRELLATEDWPALASYCGASGR